jgi:C4-dicarboxylate-specific signal transduction histidine kinase
MFDKLLLRWRAGLGILLFALFAGFLVSTVWLYLNNDMQRRQLALSVRSSGWVSYQAELEYVKFTAALGLCLTAPEQCDIKDVGMRAALLASRLDILANSEEGRTIRTIDTYRSALNSNFAALAAFADAVAAEPTKAHLPLANEFDALGETLQGVLRDAVLYNTDIQAREDLVQNFDASTAFALLMLSSAGLLGFMALEVRQRNALLRELRMLRAAETELHAGTVGLLEALPAPVLVLTGTSEVGFANAAAKAFAVKTGAGDDLALLAAGIAPLSDRRGTDLISHEEPYVGTDGAIRHLALAAAPIRWFAEEARAVIIADNTEQRDSELRAMAVAKLAVLGELSSAIAHELNQPLAVIKAAAANGRLLATNGADNTRVIEKFVRIDDQIERARRIVQNIRRLGRPDDQDWRSFGVARSINASFGLISQQYQTAGIELALDLHIDDQVSAVGDSTLFEIALINILINARDAFDEGGCLDPVRRVSVSGHYDKGEVNLVIADNAGGIPDTILPRIFDSFVTSKAPDRGTGLGLSIARRAVERMKGTITARNEGLGALFAIALPATVANHAA